MNSPFPAQASNRVPHVILCLFLLASLFPQLFWLSQPLDKMVTQSLYEDSFYYYQVARNVAQGHGALAAGGIPSNGYHPLWMFVSAGFFRVFPSDLAAIRGICGLGLLLSIAASFFVFLTLRQLRCGIWVSVFCALFFHYNPWMMSLTTSGIEAPLNALLLILGTWHLIRQNNRLCWFLMLGVIAGFAYLTRTDNIFFDAALFAVAIWTARREGAVLWRGIALAGVIAFLIILPWHLWNFVRFGQFMQGSASALPVVREIVYFDEHPGASRTDFFIYRIGLLAGWFRSIFWYSGLGSLWALLAVPLAATFFLKAERSGKRSQPNRVFSIIPLIVSVILLGIAHKFFRLATREWYYVASDVLLALLWGIATQYTLEKIRTHCRLPLAETIVLIIALVLPIPMLAKKTVVDWQDRLSRPRAYALEILDAFSKLPNLQPNEPLGSTDSGILGFLSPRPVINLDGVLNPEAGRAIRDGVLLDYMQSKGICYTIITPRMMNERILGKDYKNRLIQRPDLTPQGYEIHDTPNY
ncbi:TPA: hypothetical protein DDW35_09765 [Candidatus Sumerlaeota bacterium]|nr:hypothetical protein [Candidatus Sumerlaeota bacterium]